VDLKAEILRLKEEKDILILAHNYQIGPIQDLADFVGDSLELARKAVETKQEIILFCGVKFMAETAKILNPEKKVIVPTNEALCPMAEQLSIDEIKKAKEEYPGAEVVLYVNTNALEKTQADCVCTSANAADIVNAMDSDTVIFGPDRNLGDYAKVRSDKTIVIVPRKGHCPTHQNVGLDDVERARTAHPNAMLVVHPEVQIEIQEVSNMVASTAGILKYCKELDAREFIIGTEVDMLYRLRKELPGKKFYLLSENMICPNMKKNTLENVLAVLETENNEVILSEEILSKAKKPIERMLELSK
jgi:quinolinate synthase